MDRFLKKTAVFAIITIILLAAGEFAVRHMTSSYSFKDEWLRQNGAKVNTLILGSSHTYYGLKPELLGDSVFNLANISQSPEYDLYLLEHYLPCCPNLKKVILPISYFTYRDAELEESDAWTLCINYKVDMHLPVHSDFSIYNLKLADYNSYFGRLRGLVKKQESNRCDSLGFGLGFELDSRLPAWKKQLEQRVSDLTQNNPGRPSEAVAALHGIIDLCKEHDIECIFITTPVYSGFAEAMDTDQYNEMMHLTDSIVMSERIRYYDFFTDSSFTDSDFHDVDHLSDVGAVHLSEKLRDLLYSR